MKFKSKSIKKTKTRLFVREDPNILGTPFKFLIISFNKIRCSKFFMDGFRKTKNSKPLRNVLISPFDKLRFILFPFLNKPL